MAVSRTDKRIMQIMAADGWVAVYADEEKEFSIPLVCWALVCEPDGFQYVAGMDVSDLNDFSDTNLNFVRYEHASEIARDAAKERQIAQ